MIELFSRINEFDKKSLLQLLDAQTSSFPAGVSVYEEDNKSHIGIVESGIIQIIRNDYNGDRVLIEELAKNQIFGSNISSITSSDYEVLSICPTTITYFDYNDVFTSKIQSHKSYTIFLENLLKILSEVIVKRNERIEILAKKTIRERLLAYFNLVSRSQKSKRISIPFNYTELADYLGVNRCAMYRELKNMKEERLITIQKKMITLYIE